MLRYVARRLATMAATLVIISMLVFVIINLPPGDFLSNQIAELRAIVVDGGLDAGGVLGRDLEHLGSCLGIRDR